LEIAVIEFDVYRKTLSEIQMKLPKIYEFLPRVQKGMLYLRQGRADNRLPLWAIETL